MNSYWDSLSHALISSTLFTAVGVVCFLIAFFVIKAQLPFSIRKEIEEDQNVAVAIIMAAVILGIAMIVSAAVHG